MGKFMTGKSQHANSKPGGLTAGVRLLIAHELEQLRQRADRLQVTLQTLEELEQRQGRVGALGALELFPHPGITTTVHERSGRQPTRPRVTPGSPDDRILAAVRDAGAAGARPKDVVTIAKLRRYTTLKRLRELAADGRLVVSGVRFGQRYRLATLDLRRES
jgi:hypothetical protein